MIDLKAALARVTRLLEDRGIDPSTHYSVSVEVDHHSDGDHVTFTAYAASGSGVIAYRRRAMDEAIDELAMKLDHHLAALAPRTEPEDVLVVVPESPRDDLAPVDATLSEFEL